MIAYLVWASFFCAGLLPLSYAADDSLIKGYLKEVTLTAPVAAPVFFRSNNGYEYIADNSTLIINAQQGSSIHKITVADRSITPGDLTFTVSDIPSVWHFYTESGGYAAKSGATPLHQLQISLPDCSFGNICNPLHTFSVVLPQVNEKNSHLVRFFMDGQDVTTFFYYHSDHNRFQIKEYYEAQFFRTFNGLDGWLEWKLSDNQTKLDGKIRILLGDKTIKGTILDESGEVPVLLAGKMITFSFPGSDEIVPHSIQARIDSKGRYEIHGLATFAYTFSVDILPYGEMHIESLSTSPENIVTLELAHTVPKFDMVLSSAAKDSYQPGEFVIFKPSSWDPRLTGHIMDFRQVMGDPVQLTVFTDKIAVLFPEKRMSSKDLVFLGTIGEKRIILKLPHPVPLDGGYEQFGMLDSAGVYAHTQIKGFDEGDVMAFSSDLTPSANLNSVAKASKDSVKVHLYDENNKVSDITAYFTWDTSAQTITLMQNKRRDLYNALQNTPSTLAVAFCNETRKDMCFRIRKKVRPGGANVMVDIGSVRPRQGAGKHVVLRQINAFDTSVVRIAEIDTEGRAIFSGIPSGAYQILLADTSLQYYGYTYANVTDGINAERGTVRVNLSVMPLSDDMPDRLQQIVTNGNLVRLADKPIRLQSTDYRMFDLEDLDAGLSDSVSDFRLLGALPGEYILYPDNHIMVITSDAATDSYATFLFTSNGNLYQLPLHYSGNDVPVIKEEGVDYTMCPDEWPLCRNAFVSVTGVKRGVYNGRSPLSLTFPVPFKKQDVRVLMESITDITSMFTIDAPKQTITLKKEYIPGFLSNISTNKEPITIMVKNRIYTLSLLAGYKSVEVSIVDENGGQTSLFSGLNAHLRCQSPDIHYSRIAMIKGAGSIVFDDLPDCDYSLRLIDRKRLFYGKLDHLSLSAGQNKIRTIFPVACVGSNDQYVKNCRPFLPLLQDNRLIAPDFGMLFADRYLPMTKSVAILPKNSLLEYKILGRGVLIFAPLNNAPAMVKNALLLNSDGKSAEITLTYDDIRNHLVRTVAAPPKMSAKAMIVTGVSPSFIYLGNEPLVFHFQTNLEYTENELSVFVENGREQISITNMFIWDNAKKTLTLKPDEYDSFLSKLSGRQKQITIFLAPEDPGRRYSFIAVIGAGTADIIAEIGVDAQMPPLKNGKAILIGRKSKNGNEYRQLVDIKNNMNVYFPNVPLGIYELVLFDMSQNLFGSRELSVYSEHSELYINVEMNLITD